MTSEELAAVCEGHEGKPWWPDGLAYHDDLNQWLADVEIADTVNESHHFKIRLEPDAAADMILGSAVRWLACATDCSPLVIAPSSDPASPKNYWSVGLLFPREDIPTFECRGHFRGGTLLAAVLAACKEVEPA